MVPHNYLSKYLSITLDPGHYFSKHWMRVLPIAESPRGGFIPKNKIPDVLLPRIPASAIFKKYTVPRLILVVNNKRAYF